MDEEEFRARLLKPLDDIHRRTLSENEQISKNESTPKNQMSLMKYVSNPTGKGSAYVANRSAIKNGLNMEYIRLLREYRRAFYAVPYICTNGDVLYHVKVPSQFYKDNKISYDVLFLLKYDPNIRRPNRMLQLYSNSPSFIFTYCYVYNQDGLIIEDLKSKLPNEALTKFPEVRNPIGSYGYEKSTYIRSQIFNRWWLSIRCIC